MAGKRKKQKQFRNNNDPLKQTRNAVMGGAGLMIGASIISGVSRGLNNMGRQ